MGIKGFTALVCAASFVSLSCKTTNASSLKDASDGGAPGSGTDTATGIATQRATCPFIGSAVASGVLPYQQSATRPLASIDSVAGIGDSGGGDLGTNVLTIFATGNHALMRGSDSSTTLDTPVPSGLFSLDFPGSQGSHPGHSGILEGDPTVIDSGRFDPDAFARLTAFAADGHIKRSDVGRFIAGNLKRDPNSKVFGPHTAALLGGDIVKFVASGAQALLAHLQSLTTGNSPGSEERQLITSLTKIAGEDNLIGSSGEFGLLFAFLANSPNTTTVGGEPALSVDDLTSMFRDKRFPDGWDSWQKTSHSWVMNSIALSRAAAAEYIHPTVATTIDAPTTGGAANSGHIVTAGPNGIYEILCGTLAKSFFGYYSILPDGAANASANWLSMSAFSDKVYALSSAWVNQPVCLMGFYDRSNASFNYVAAGAKADCPANQMFYGDAGCQSYDQVATDVDARVDPTGSDPI